MKAKYKPIAMKCNQEEFDSIKDMIPLPIEQIVSFGWCPYLLIEDGVISNCIEKYCDIYKIDRLEYFDGKYFLECCGVQVLEDVSEQVWNGLEIQWRYVEDKHWNDSGRGLEYRLKPKPNINADIEALHAKAKDLGIEIEIITK